jgi:hypothetical protein
MRHTDVAKLQEGIPHERIELQRVNEVFDRFLLFRVCSPELAQQTRNGGCIWNVLSLELRMLIFSLSQLSVLFSVSFRRLET